MTNKLLRGCFFACVGWLLVQQSVVAQEKVTIVLNGVDDKIKQNIELMLSLSQQKSNPSLNARRIQHLYEKSVDEIKEAIKPFGYFRPTIASTIKQDKSQWRIEYLIELNDPVRITYLDIKILGEAKDDAAFNQLIAALPLKESDVLDQRVYSETKKKMQSLAANRGYFDAAFAQHKITVNMARYDSEVVLHFDSGKRYRYGEIRLDSTSPNEVLVRKFINFKPGDYYTTDALIDLQVAYSDTDYFESVEIAPRTEEITENTVPIEIRLLPRTKRRYSLGMGYGTDTGIRGRVGIDAPLVNDKGHRYDASILTSEIKDSVTAHYRMPVMNPRTDEVAFTSSYSDEITETSSSEAYTLGVGLVRARGAWRETLSLTYQEERFAVAGDKGQTTLFMPGISWYRIWGDSKLYTRNGTSLSLDLRGAHKSFLSDVTFSQAKAYSKWIRGIGQFGRVIFRGTAGTTFANEFTSIPSSVRFFAGGDNSIRGYKYNSLGPEDDKGEVTGGRRLVVVSLEYEHNIVGNWDAAVFYDEGNAVDSWDESRMRGAGVGLRWKSPVGPMRLDYAQALSIPGRPWEYHLNLGPDL